MRCDCCGQKKKLFESFAQITFNGGKLNFCIECNDLAYKVRDAYKEVDEAKYLDLLDRWEKRAKKASPLFKTWQAAFLSSFVNPSGAEDATDQNESKK